MTYKVRITKTAQVDMRNIYRYIADDLNSPVAAAHCISLIDDAIRSLKENPTRCPLVRDKYLASRGYRIIVVKNYLVFFVVREKEQAVSIMRVLYGRRDWVRLLKVEQSV